MIALLYINSQGDQEKAVGWARLPGAWPPWKTLGVFLDDGGRPHIRSAMCETPTSENTAKPVYTVERCSCALLRDIIAISTKVSDCHDELLLLRLELCKLKAHLGVSVPHLSQLFFQVGAFCCIVMLLISSHFCTS